MTTDQMPLPLPEPCGAISEGYDGFPWKSIGTFSDAGHITNMPNGTKVYAEPDVLASIQQHAAQCVAAANSEIDRLRFELAKVNNEFGSETADWPEAWTRVAKLKEIQREACQELAAERERARVLVEALREALDSLAYVERMHGLQITGGLVRLAVIKRGVAALATYGDKP